MLFVAIDFAPPCSRHLPFLSTNNVAAQILEELTCKEVTIGCTLSNKVNMNMEYVIYEHPNTYLHSPVLSLVAR